MSELLQNWLNNEVGLSTNVANFEKDFASGYLFGEVLHKFRQQDDFEQFVNKSAYEAKLENFKRLEPTLKALGIRVNATQSNQMMNGDRGASLRLLYQLKMATERLLLASDAGSAQAKRSGGGTVVGKGAGLGGDVTKGIRVPRDHFDKHERRFFEHRLRATCPNAKQDRLKKVEAKYESEMHKQEALAFHMDNLEQGHIAEQREIHRFGTRERMRQNRVAKDEWTRSHIEHWGANMEKRADREAFDVSFAQRVNQQHDNKVSSIRASTSAEVRDGVEAFEAGLTNLGLTKPKEKRRAVVVDPQRDSDSDSSDASDLHAERLLKATTPAANARELVEALQARMPNGEELEQEAGLFLQKIKESKRAGSIARKERERRRRRVLVEQQREQDLLEESKLEDVLMEKLSRQSAEEKVISYNVWKTQRYEDVIVGNRQLRQQEYTARRKDDQQEALRRDQDLRLEMLETVREQEERERTRYRAIERGRHASRRAQLAEECERILELISGMAFAAIEQEQITDTSEVDPTLWREWTALFVENKEVPSTESIAKSTEEVYPLTATPQAGVDGLDDAAFRDYVSGKGQWESRQIEHPAQVAPAADFDLANEAKAVLQMATDNGLSFVGKLTADVDVVDGRPVNYRLGAVVAALLDREYAEKPQPQPPAMPQVPLKLVITGKPFAGKKTVAVRLAEAYNLQVVDADEVIHQCLMLSKRPDANQPAINVLSFTHEGMDDHCQKHEDDGNPYIKQLQEIGYEVQAVLDRGEALSDELYVNLITTKIRSLFPDEVPKQDVVDKEFAAVEPAAMPDDGAQIAEADLTAGAPLAADATAKPAAEADDVAEDATIVAADATAKPAAEADDIAEDATIEPSGWILLGFPDSSERLQLLERFLSGWVETGGKPTPEAEKRKAQAALIAPAPPQEPPPFELKPGGYDLHFRLDVHGDEVLRRAFGQRKDPATSLIYHLEDHPPCSKHQIIYERLVPIDDVHNSMGTLTSRIHCFDISQSEVDYLLSYFGPFPDCQRLTMIDANKTQDEVYDALDEHVAMLLDRKRDEKAKALAAKAAEKAAAKEASEAADAEARPESAEAAPDEAVPAPAADAGRTPTPGAEEPAELPPVELSELPKKIEDLEETLFKLLLAEWQGAEKEFMKDSRELFAWHIAHLADFRSGLHGLQRRFVEFLQRPDDKQSQIDDFVQKFNAFSEEYPDMRKQDKTKEELHQQVDDIHGRLETKINDDRQTSLDHLDEIEKSGWVEAQVDVVASQVQHAVQMEAKRYHAACQLLGDFYFSAMGSGLPAPREMPTINALTTEEHKEEVPDPKAKAKAKAKGKTAEEEPPEAGSKGDKKRKYIEAKDEETGEEKVGHWEFPFLQDLMSQAKKAIWPLEEFVAPANAEKADELDADPKAKAKAKAKGKASPTPDAAPSTKFAPQLSPLYIDFQQSLIAERVTYTHRLATLHNWAYRRLVALSISASEAFSQCRDWVLLRRQKQLDAVEGLVDILKEHIESDPPMLLGARLTLEGAHLHQHHNVRLQPPTPEIIPPSVEAAAPCRWTIQQLDGLFEMVSGVARAIGDASSLVPVRSVQSVFARLTQDLSDDIERKEQPRVPSFWRPCREDRLTQLSSLFEYAPCGGTVDCVELLLHIGLLHSPLGWPSRSDLLEVRAALEDRVPKGASWPDFYISPEDLETLPLFSDPNGKEADFAQKNAPSTTSAPSTFDRARAQLRWVGRVLQRFAAPAQQMESWALEVAAHDFLVRGQEEGERIAEQLNDMRSTSSNSPRSPTEGLGLGLGLPDPKALGAADPLGDDDEDDSKPRPLPPRPEMPRNLPGRPAGGISVRQLLAYLCAGVTPEEGFATALAVLGPGPTLPSTVPTAAVQAVLLQLGARPLPPGQSGDGRPALPSRAQICEELGLHFSTVTSGIPASSLSGAAAAGLLEKFGLSRRHCRAQVEKLFPHSGGKGAAQKARRAMSGEPS